ncbi:MAG: prephenate dehydrogenase/arogenate dehydrogenase family protein [Candidatus Brocadia sp.]|nr:Cyclohexadienyl dehydrogenase [Candidatus Brocadia fulgida]MCE7910541.1 prephenate dehydrogenase [Candidatus Brocadia sp. AMX3]RIK03111.1 MAG: prephenate dehydrogenase/arogenate dehydrogenase family protein [Candidatus Brocadia sp.]
MNFLCLKNFSLCCDSMQFGTVCIIGPGLIGGSVGLGLKKRDLAKAVIGVGHKASSIENALKMQAIDSGTLDIDSAVKDADIVILATAVDKIIDTATRVIPLMKGNAILTDVGSTKNEIVKQITRTLREDIAFVGSHPIAGSEQRGVEYASSDLFAGCNCILTPPSRHAKGVETIASLWQLLGARIIYLSPEQHDEILAYVSHLPHLIASCLVNSIKQEHLVYAASGLRDTTRVASGDPELWINIFDQNRENVIRSIDQLMTELTGFRNDLVKRNDASLLDRLTKAKVSRDSVFHNNSKNQGMNK